MLTASARKKNSYKYLPKNLLKLKQAFFFFFFFFCKINFLSDNEQQCRIIFKHFYRQNDSSK